MVFIYIYIEAREIRGRVRSIRDSVAAGATTNGRKQGKFLTHTHTHTHLLTLPAGVRLDGHPLFEQKVQGPQRRLDGPAHRAHEDEAYLEPHAGQLRPEVLPQLETLSAAALGELRVRDGIVLCFCPVSLAPEPGPGPDPARRETLIVYIV